MLNRGVFLKAINTTSPNCTASTGKVEITRPFFPNYERTDQQNNKKCTKHAAMHYKCEDNRNHNAELQEHGLAREHTHEEREHDEEHKRAP